MSCVRYVMPHASQRTTGEIAIQCSNVSPLNGQGIANHSNENRAPHADAATKKSDDAFSSVAAWQQSGAIMTSQNKQPPRPLELNPGWRNTAKAHIVVARPAAVSPTARVARISVIA